MRAEVEDLLHLQGIEFFQLPLTARLLLVTDGTVTELLEAMVKEKLKIGYNRQIVTDLHNHPEFQELHNITECLERAITLQGSDTGKHWLYAESVVLHQLLPEAARTELGSGEHPIGTVLRRYTSDNHRRMKDCGFRRNQRAAEALDTDPALQFLFRSYQVLVGPNPIMSITEWFPVDRIEREI